MPADRLRKMGVGAMNAERWSALAAHFGLRDANAVFVQLIKAYGEQQRHYHTAAHIDRCLQLLDVSAQRPRHAHEVEYALWFHDAVYEPLSSTNEARSAKWACGLLDAAKVGKEAVERVRSHILATRHAAAAADHDAQLVVDVDLSILGAPAEEYALFEADVREEYRWVPDFLYRGKRAEILQSFLDRPHIYCNDYFRARFEAAARLNLKQAIDGLKA